MLRTDTHVSMISTAGQGRQSPFASIGKSVGAGLFALLCSGTAHATLIDVQFKSNGASGNGTAGQTYTGAAVIGGATDQWNQISATSGTAVALSSSTGLASGLNFTWSANAVYGVVPSASGFNSTSYANLMQSFAVTHSGNAAMTMQYHGLSAGQAFSLYIYGQSDGNSSNFGDTITVNGATQTLLESNISSFVNGTNYLLFNGVADASGNISISAVNAAGKSEADINGLQLSFTQVPEPASILLFGASIAGVVVARRRKRCDSPTAVA